MFYIQRKHNWRLVLWVMVLLCASTSSDLNKKNQINSLERLPSGKSKINLLPMKPKFIWVLLLQYLGIRDTINHLLPTTSSVYHNIIHELQDNPHILMTLLSLSPSIISYVQYIQTLHPQHNVLFFFLREYCRNINVHPLGLLEKSTSVYYGRPKPPCVVQLDQYHDCNTNSIYRYLYNFKTHEVTLYNDREHVITQSFLAPLQITLFYLFQFSNNVQFLFRWDEIEWCEITEQYVSMTFRPDDYVILLAFHYYVHAAHTLTIADQEGNLSKEFLVTIESEKIITKIIYSPDNMF